MEEQEQELTLRQRIRKSKAFIPALIFIFAIALFSISSRFSDRLPALNDVTPAVAFPGDVIVLSGRYFGAERQGGEITIAGMRIPSAMYLEWQDTRISLVVPRDAGSGPLIVTTRNGKSNGLIFTNRSHIPLVLAGPAEPGFPYIESISPTSGSVGTRIIITGQNFGTEKGSGKVWFTSISPTDTLTAAAGDVGAIEAYELDFDYEVWTDREIHVRIPDGASSGGMMVSTNAGNSNSLYVEVSEPVGSKILKQKRGYQVQYGVQVKNITAAGANSLYLWVPQIYEGIEQRNMEKQSQLKPLWQTYPGLLVYKFEDLKTGLEYGVTETFWFERYAMESRLSPEKIKVVPNDTPYDKTSKLYQVFTAPNEMIPSGEEQIIKRAKELTVRDRNPYHTAARIYSYLTDTITIDKTPAFNSALGSLEAKRGDSFSVSLLFCALARASGIPARPVAGYIVYGNRIPVKHYWAEFYIQDYGWLPVDAALGAGVRWPGYPDLSGTGTQSPKEFYFGNIDNQHIVISRGLLPAIQISPSGLTSAKTRFHSFQNIYEESNQITAYSSVWSEASIVEWW